MRVRPLHRGLAAALLAVLLTSAPLAGYAENPAPRKVSPIEDAAAEPMMRAYLEQHTGAVHQCYQGNIVSTRYAVRVQFTLGAYSKVLEVRVLTRGRFVPPARIACVVRTLKELKLPETAQRSFVYTFSWGMADPLADLPTICRGRHCFSRSEKKFRP